MFFKPCCHSSQADGNRFHPLKQVHTSHQGLALFLSSYCGRWNIIPHLLLFTHREQLVVCAETILIYLLIWVSNYILYGQLDYETRNSLKSLIKCNAKSGWLHWWVFNGIYAGLYVNQPAPWILCCLCPTLLPSTLEPMGMLTR